MVVLFYFNNATQVKDSTADRTGKMCMWLWISILRLVSFSKLGEVKPETRMWQHIPRKTGIQVHALFDVESDTFLNTVNFPHLKKLWSNLITLLKSSTTKYLWSQKYVKTCCYCWGFSPQSLNQSHCPHSFVSQQMFHCLALRCKVASVEVETLTASFEFSSIECHRYQPPPPSAPPSYSERA